MSRLTLAGGRVLDPGRGVDGAADIVMDDGVIAGPGDAAGGPGDAAGQAWPVIDVTGLIVTPGLLDLHTHLYPGVSHYGVEPDTYCLCGAASPRLSTRARPPRRSPGCAAVIERAETRILAFLTSPSKE
jgi:dihydroorotase